MADVDMEWIKNQLQNAKVKKMVGDSVIKLLQTWEEVKITEKLEQEAIEVFYKLANNQALVKESKEEVWTSVIPGQVKVADEVRVKLDAFTGELGRLHNGRRGKVVAVRYGDVIIKSTDGKEPLLDGAHYSPYKLDKLVR
jgi:phosphoribosyl-ATP pyrophosphohydrolase